MPVIAADGGSPAEFVHEARQLPNLDLVTHNESSGLIGQVRTSLRRALAAGSSRILYTEPDKAEFFETSLPSFIDAADAVPPDGVVVCARSPESFETYPASQRHLEAGFNRLCATLTGTESDYLYGPFVMPTDLIPLLDDLPPSVGWGWRPYVFVRASRMRRPVTCITGDFPCPADQREDSAEERAHRLAQLAQNLRGLEAAIENEKKTSGIFSQT